MTMTMMILVRCFTTHTKIAACFGFLLRLKLAKPSKNIHSHQNKAPNSGYRCGAGVGGGAGCGGAPMPGYPAWYRVQPPSCDCLPPAGVCRSVCVCVLVCNWPNVCCAAVRLLPVPLSLRLFACLSVCLSHCLFVNCNAPSLSVFAAVFCFFFFFFCMWRCDENCPCWMGNWGIEEPCMEQGRSGATRQAGEKGHLGLGLRQTSFDRHKSWNVFLTDSVLCCSKQI